MKKTALLRFAALLWTAALPLFAQQHGLTSRPDVDAYYDGIFPTTPPAVPGNWSTVIAFPNLTFLNPVGLAPIPGTNKLIVWERDGKIWSFDNNAATTTKTLVIDLSANVQGWDDSGLLGLALHPDFQNNRQMWIWYNWRGGITGGSGDLGPVIGNANTRPPTSTPTRNRLSRFVLDTNFQTTQAGEYVVIDQQDASVWHNGGGMFFHPQNGFLYITNGDDQNAGLNTQRNDRALFSCVIRIDVDQRGGAISHVPTKRPLNEVSPTWPRYYVPNDNPFVGQPNALEEMFAIGLRSPHRMTIDPVTGRIFIGDVGNGAREEVSVIEPNDPPGLNFQWSTIEGKGGELTGSFIGTSKPPIIDYAHSSQDGSCVIGGYVYRGSEFPELYGKYIFGDNMTGIVWYLDESVSPAVKVPLAVLPDGPGPNSGNDYRGLGSFGLDANGELYMCRLSSTEGRIYKLQRGGPPPGSPLPATLGATGLFSNLTTLSPDARLIPYQLNEPFWSDGAIKSRFAAIPNGTTIGFQPSGEWNFPHGTVLVKHFDLPVSDTDPNAKRRLETRVIVKQDDGEVYGATYKWRADQSDADLLDGGLTESIPIATTPIGSLSSQDIGSPALAGSTVRNGNVITITAGGTDIWGTSDQFHFAHQQRTGDFDVSVRIESVVQSDLYTKTGLMVRDSLAANARHVMALVFPSNAARNNNTGGYEFQYRATTGGGATALYPAAPQPRVNYPDTWLRMRREGDTFIAYWSSDGFTWAEYSRTTLDLPDQLYFGLAVTAHTASPTTVAKFHVDSRRQPWYFPSRQDCLRCHNPQSGGVLGPSTRQFNREMLFPNGVTDQQLSAWNHIGLFDDGPEDAELPGLEKLSHHSDTSASLQERARSYLDANCSYCHRPNGVHALWDARYLTPFQDQGIYYGPVLNSLGNPNARVVVPQSLTDSILHHRLSITGENQMPPLGRNLVDKDGVAMLEAWINSLPEENVAAPALLVATAVSNTQVNLSWQDLSDNESGFSIERSLDGVNFTSLAIVGPGATSFSD
ncbi:MAG TPA: PQQ-dependent sugar dehydrogenase, partial [Haloferula sp.]